MQHAPLVAASVSCRPMHRNPAMMPVQSAAHPRTGGYGPVGQAINRTQQHSQPQPLQSQPFPPPPPPPYLPSPPPGTFTHPKPTGPPLPTLLSPSSSPTLSPPQSLRNKPQTLPPADFTPSPTHWDTRSVFGLDLPRFIKHTPHTEANHTAGMPITDLTILQTVRHGWNSYWLRYLAHGYNTGVFFTKHISETMFASELFSGLRAKKIDLDATAIAYCHQHNIPAPTKQKALSALVSEFVEYMQDVNNDSNPAPSKASQHNTQGPQLKTPQQPDPATAQRLLTLEHQLATANLTISTQPTPNMNTQPDNIKATSADISPIAPRNLQPHLDSLMQESAHRRNLPPGDINLHPQVVDITSSPIPGASQETALYSPSPQYHDDDSKPVAPHPRDAAHPTPFPDTNPMSQPHQHTTAPAPRRHAKSNTDGTSQASKPILADTSKKQGKRTIQLGSNSTLLKKQRQSTLPGAPTPKPKMPVEATSPAIPMVSAKLHRRAYRERNPAMVRFAQERIRKTKNRMPHLHQRGVANIPRDHT